jgi:outer membrane protein OmpA-like peptidoglycan-associated protein
MRGYPRFRRGPLGFRTIHTGYPRRRFSPVGRLFAIVVLGIFATAAYTYMRPHSADNRPGRIIIAGTATSNEPDPVLSTGIIGLLRSSGSTSTRATAYVVKPGISQPDVISLTPRLPSGAVDYGPTRSSVLNSNIGKVRKAVQDEAADGPFDVLATIAAAIRAAPPPATLIIITSGLSTSGGLDFRRAGWYASPRSVATQLKASGLLPLLAGYRVILSGLGTVAGRQPALPLPQQSVLRAYWMAICQAAQAAACSTDESDRATPPTRSSIPVPVVGIPRIHAFEGPHERTTTVLPDALLFSFNSAHLVPSANNILRPICRRARQRHLMLTIIGHASPDGGTAEYNQALSFRRASAVRRRLIALGLPAAQIIKVRGVGTAGDRPDACLVYGHLDEEICGQLRRVVIISRPFPVGS